MPYEQRKGFRLPRNREPIIWHYIKSQYFLKLLDEEKLWFRSVRDYGDSFEGSIPAKMIADPPAEDDNISTIASKLAHNSELARFSFNDIYLNYAHCWTMRQSECIGMWKIFVDSAPKDQGVAIQSTITDLLGAFHTTSETVYVGQVNFEMPVIRLPECHVQPYRHC